MSTPALARATEEYRKHRAEFTEDDEPLSCTGCDYVVPYSEDGGWDHPAFQQHRIAATLSAALHDPDDPAWLPNVIAAAVRVFHSGPSSQPLSAVVADAVRAAILAEVE